LQKLTLQKGLTPSADEAGALAESERLFLTNQTKYQEMNDQIATLSEQLSELESRQRNVQEKLQTQRPAIQAEFDRLQSRHQFRLAALKLAILLPLLGFAVWLFLRKRGSLYAPLLYGFGLALLVKVGMVMHEYFPRRYFKYVLIVIAIVLVARVLIYLLRVMAFPKLDWLLKQYREAYEHFLCPVCNHPIRRGPRQYLFWTRASLKKLPVPATGNAAADEPYTCPVCATTLFEECPACKRIRHSLLPACSHCGATKQLPPAATSHNPGSPSVSAE
jgi:transcription elongation factor Elf1